MPEKHLRWGGSTVVRTEHCPDWVNLADDVPRPGEKTNAAAERGTRLHKPCELHLGEGTPLEKLIADLPLDDAEAVRAAVHHANCVMDDYDCTELVCEQLVRHSDEVGGSVDLLACGNQYAVVLDFKFGYQPVNARSQLMFYAACAWHDPETRDMIDGKEVVLVKVQPATDPVVAIDVVSVHECRTFLDRILAAVEIGRKGGRNGNPGDHCHYCPAAPYCPAKRAQMAHFNSADPKQIADLVDAMELVAQAKVQIKAVEAETLRLLEAGERVPGWKLVLKRAIRKFNADRTPELLRKFKAWRGFNGGAYLEPPKLKSPAQIEKSLKAAGRDFDLTPFIDDTKPGVTCVRESDRRPAVAGAETMPDGLARVLEKA